MHERKELYQEQASVWSLLREHERRWHDDWLEGYFKVTSNYQI
jgi:hypothetical protein